MLGGSPGTLTLCTQPALCLLPVPTSWETGGGQVTPSDLSFPSACVCHFLRESPRLSPPPIDSVSP